MNLITNSLGADNFINSSLGDVTTHTDGRGFVTTYNYNARRQLTNSVAPTNLVNRIAYDAVGNALTATDARGNSLTNTWSATRHLLATALPVTPQGSPVVTNLYDDRDWLVQTLDPNKQSVVLTNDLDGRLIAATDPLNRTTTMVYDADGRQLSAANAAHETNSQTCDARGSLIQAMDGANHSSTRAYHPAGNQIILTNRNGNKWQFQFDAANRLTNTITPWATPTPSPLIIKACHAGNRPGRPKHHQHVRPSRPSGFARGQGGHHHQCLRRQQ